MYQNSRCSGLFKNGVKGESYYINAIVWKGEEEWDTYTGKVYIDDISSNLISSSQIVKFPFKPKTFYIDVINIPISKEKAESNNIHYIEDKNNNCYYTILKDKNQLNEVFNYYEIQNLD
jgi:hypothetical protein